MLEVHGLSHFGARTSTDRSKSRGRPLFGPLPNLSQPRSKPRCQDIGLSYDNRRISVEVIRHPAVDVTAGAPWDVVRAPHRLVYEAALNGTGEASFRLGMFAARPEGIEGRMVELALAL